MNIQAVNTIICVAALLVCVACLVGVQLNLRKIQRANEQLSGETGDTR